MPKIPQEYFTKVLNHYFGDHAKAWEWFRTRQPNLMGGTPLGLIKEGKADRVMNHINREMFNPEKGSGVDDFLKEMFRKMENDN